MVECFTLEEIAQQTRADGTFAGESLGRMNLWNERNLTLPEEQAAAIIEEMEAIVRGLDDYSIRYVGSSEGKVSLMVIAHLIKEEDSIRKRLETLAGLRASDKKYAEVGSVYYSRKPKQGDVTLTVVCMKNDCYPAVEMDIMNAFFSAYQRVRTPSETSPAQLPHQNP